jgi:hypothetical protein
LRLLRSVLGWPMLLGSLSADVRAALGHVREAIIDAWRHSGRGHVGMARESVGPCPPVIRTPAIPSCSPSSSSASPWRSRAMSCAPPCPSTAQVPQNVR